MNTLWGKLKSVRKIENKFISSLANWKSSSSLFCSFMMRGEEEGRNFLRGWSSTPLHPKRIFFLPSFLPSFLREIFDFSKETKRKKRRGRQTKEEKKKRKRSNESCWCPIKRGGQKKKKRGRERNGQTEGKRSQTSAEEKTSRKKKDTWVRPLSTK